MTVTRFHPSSPPVLPATGLLSCFLRGNMGGRASRELSESQQTVKRLTSELQVFIATSEFALLSCVGSICAHSFPCSVSIDFDMDAKSGIADPTLIQKSGIPDFQKLMKEVESTKADAAKAPTLQTQVSTLSASLREIHNPHPRSFWELSRIQAPLLSGLGHYNFPSFPPQPLRPSLNPSPCSTS